MKRDIELEATLVAKYAAVEPVLDERSRRRWAAAESRAIGYGGDAVVSSATGLARETIRKGRREISRDEAPTDRIRRPGGGRPRIQQDQPGIEAALEALVDPLTRGDPTSPLRWTCKSRAKLAAALNEQGWRVSSTTVGRLLHRLGYRLQSPRKRQEGATHPDRNGSGDSGRNCPLPFLRLDDRHVAAHAMPLPQYDEVDTAVPVDVVRGEAGGAVVQGLAVRQTLRGGRLLPLDPGVGLVAEPHAAPGKGDAAIDKHLDVASRPGERVGVDVVVAGVHQEQILEPVVIDVEVRQPGDRRESVEETSRAAGLSGSGSTRRRRSPAPCCTG